MRRVVGLLFIMFLVLAAVASRAGPTQTGGQNEGLQEAERLDREADRFYGQGRYSEAIPLVQKALAIREKVLRPDHPDVATGLNNLAELYRLMGDYARAEPLFKRSLAIWKKIRGPEHP